MNQPYFTHCFTLLNVPLQEKTRKPRGKGDGDAEAKAAPAEGEGKASGAAQAALDAMEQLVNTLAHGKEDMGGSQTTDLRSNLSMFTN